MSVENCDVQPFLLLSAVKDLRLLFRKPYYMVRPYLLSLSQAKLSALARRDQTISPWPTSRTSQIFHAHLSRNVILPSNLFPNLLAPNLTMGSRLPHSKCQHASSGPDNARVDDCWSAMLQLARVDKCWSAVLQLGARCFIL